MAVGIAINGKKLHEVRMPLESHYKDVVSLLSFPKTQFRFSLEGATLRLEVPILLGMELYRSGLLPQDPQTPVTIAIGGRSKGRFKVVDVRYQNYSVSGFAYVTITLSRAK